MRRGLVTRALSFALLLAAPVARADISTYHDIWYGVLQHCDGCHGPNATAANGGLTVHDDGFGITEDGWYSALVGVPAANPAAKALGKLRVTPNQPWNSYLLDKLTGHLKLGEGRPMPSDALPYVTTCPGAIDKITKWILNGALRRYYSGASQYSTYDPNDSAPGNVDCGALGAPAFSAPVPSGAVQLLGEPFTVASPSGGKNEVREGEHATAVSLANDLLVGRIQVVASAGTEYVVVSRGDKDAAGDDVPLVVARGRSLDVTLPAGVAVSLRAGQPITIRQRIRNDYWISATPYVNQTVGRVAVNLFPVASADRRATPFIEATGTALLAVPPRALGQTGGAWASAAPATGALVGLWTDARAIEASVADPLGETLHVDEEPLPASNPEPALTRGYVSMSESGLLPGALVYQCTHSNGFTKTANATVEAELNSPLRLFPTTTPFNRPLKFACVDTPTPLDAVVGPPPAGRPAIAGASPIDCVKSIHDATPPAYDDSDCTRATADNCAPANLVGGPGVNDGRCTLVGLVW